MPRLPDIERGVYVCPDCLQTVQRTKAGMQTPMLLTMFQGRLPAYLLCGRCLSKHPGKPAPLLWRTDLKAPDRSQDLYGHYGLMARAPLARTPYRRVKDVSFARCKRYVVHVTDMPADSDPGAILQRAEAEIDELKTIKGRFNSAAIHYALSVADAIEGRFFAVVDYAPNGVWADADTVRPGDYKTHQFRIMR